MTKYEELVSELVAFVIIPGVIWASSRDYATFRPP